MSERTDHPMSYEELMAAHRQESKQTALAKLKPDFYKRMADYIEALENRCKEETKGGDLSGMLHSQLGIAKDKSVNLYEMRIRKIALIAMNSAFGAEVKLENAAEEEMEVFESLKAVFSDHSKRTLRPECSEIQVRAAEKIEAAKTTKAKAETVTEIGDAKPEQDKSEDAVLLRILEDLPPFAGVDRNYQLMKEDVISLPKNIAEVLLKKNKAIEVKQSA